jgi:fibrillarin-like rRNA methylase
VRVYAEADYNLVDNEYPEEIAKLFASIATYLRTNLLKETDAVLGIGASVGLEDIGGNNRAALYAVLEWVDV